MSHPRYRSSKANPATNRLLYKTRKSIMRQVMKRVLKWLKGEPGTEAQQAAYQRAEQFIMLGQPNRSQIGAIARGIFNAK